MCIRDRLRTLLHVASAYLGLLHGVEVKVEALEVYDEVIREGLDGAPLVGVEGHRPTLACFNIAVSLISIRFATVDQSINSIHQFDQIHQINPSV